MYSEEQYHKALEIYEETQSVGKTIQLLGYPVRRQTLYNWINKKRMLPENRSTFRGFNTEEHNGYTGTVTEWLASLVGATGATGEKGDKGVKGDAGRGITGVSVGAGNILTISYSDGASEQITMSGSSTNSYQVGDTVVFGHYEQDNDLSNGKEPIEWIVVTRYGNRYLLISKKVLNYQVSSSRSSQNYHDTPLYNYMI